MQRSSTIRYTFADHQSIPEDHRRHEIIDGELFVSPTPRFNHQQVAGNLLVILRRLSSQHDLGAVVGPITVRLHDELVLEPDLVFIRKDRMHIADPEGAVHGPPDLVVEILSPSTQKYDERVKRKHYLDHGVQEVWLIDVDERSVEVWRPGAAAAERIGDTLTWRVAGEPLEIATAEVFEGTQ
jgi:Uma2 family endonuclease